MKEKLDGWEELNQHVRSVWCSELYVDHGDDGGGVGKGWRDRQADMLQICTTVVITASNNFILPVIFFK